VATAPSGKASIGKRPPFSTPNRADSLGSWVTVAVIVELKYLATKGSQPSYTRSALVLLTHAGSPAAAVVDR
jgi:hypothetical protein